MRRALPSRTAVLDALGAEQRALHVNELAEKLGVGAESTEGLLRLLDDLVFDGVLSARGQRFKLEKKRGFGAKSQGRDRRAGVVTVNPRGFGFVASPTASGDDVFVNADSLGSAMHGDQVIVEIVARGPRGAEGQIVEITKRGTTRVSGVLRRKGKNAWIELDDPRIRGPVVLTREIDRVGPEGNSGQEGQVVVAEITRFPTELGENPEGKLIAVLGQPGELAVEVNKVLFLQKIEEVHTSQAIAEAEAYGLEVPVDLLADREDLTHIPLPTIDPEDARDHDDAVWVERTDSGGYEVWVAIADVSTYVRPETKIDEEASARGCSIYLPDRAIPMLPRALSSNLCSLLPDVTRLCLAVHAELDSRGAIKKSRLVRGFMRSAAKLTYGGVARALGFTAEPPRQPKAEEMVDGLRVAHELSRILRSRRLNRGALDFDLPEPVVKLDGEGKPTSVTKRAKDPGVKKAYQLIEELMIFANEVVARWLLDHTLPGVFRVHLAPDPQKLQRLATMCEVLGIELDIDETQTPKGLARILESFADHPNAQVLNSLLLRSMKQATYDVANLGHFGLASEAYLHFTSPIRRYPDLVVHRIVHAALTGEAHARKKLLARTASPEQLQEAALQSSVAERRAMEVEREILDIYRCFYMIDRIGERFEGTVSAFVGSGAFVTLDDPFVDVLVKIEDFGGDFEIEDDGLMATSRRSGDAVRLGDRIMVEITDCAILRRTVYARRMRGEHEGPGERPARGRDEGRPRRPAGRGREEPRTHGSARGGAPSRGPKREGKAGGRPEPGSRKAAPSRKNKGGPGPARPTKKKNKKAGKKRR
ncbi:MAG: 3-to-5 exoribonuclease RNase [Labilithrix sp.]|nr:3-to-5 exoribonuclease RNase [Labilithrix sp.]